MALNLPLLALSAGAFGIGVTEFAPMGMLPTIADDLGVSIPSAGLLISAYALGVMLGAPVVTLLTAGVSRRRLLIGLAGVFTVGNLMAAVATGYDMLLVARLITSLNHGAFFGVGAVVAAGLVPQEKRAAALAAMFMGLTVANVVGVPLATWAGTAVGWRMSFLGIAALGVFTMASLAATLPPAPTERSTGMAAELRVLVTGPVLMALGLTVLGASAMFTVFTYVAAILRTETGASPAFVTAMLVVYGLGLSAGNWIGGRFADRSIDGTLAASLAGLSIVLLALAFSLHHPAAVAILVFLWGVGSFALVPPLQLRVMTAAARAPTLASAVNIGAFNLGNAIGAALGGGVIASGFGYTAVVVTGSAVAALGLVAVGLQARSSRLNTVAPGVATLSAGPRSC